MRQEERTLITRYGTGRRGEPDSGGFFRFLRCPQSADYPTQYENGTMETIPWQSVQWRKESGDVRRQLLGAAR